MTFPSLQRMIIHGSAAVAITRDLVVVLADDPHTVDPDKNQGHRGGAHCDRRQYGLSGLRRGRARPTAGRRRPGP